MAKRDALAVVAALFATLADPTRCRIVHALLRKAAGLYVFEIAAKVKTSHSAVSHQLATLTRAGFVTGTRHGQAMRYVLAKDTKTKALFTAFESLYVQARGK